MRIVAAEKQAFETFCIIEDFLRNSLALAAQEIDETVYSRNDFSVNKLDEQQHHEDLYACED